MAHPSQPPGFPITNESVLHFYEWLFAPWVKDLGLRDFDATGVMNAGISANARHTPPRAHMKGPNRSWPCELPFRPA